MEINFKTKKQEILYQSCWAITTESKKDMIKNYKVEASTSDK